MTGNSFTFDLVDMPDFATQEAALNELCPGLTLLGLSPARYKSLFHQPKPKLLIIRQRDQIITAAALVLRREGGQNRLVATLSALPHPVEPLWTRILELAGLCKARLITIEMFGPAATNGSPFANEVARHHTQVYVMDLQDADLEAGLSSNHRRNLRKAESLGFSMIETTAPEAVAAHVRLCGASNDRRAGRGEKIQGNKDRKATEAYLETGAARLFQASLRGEVLSSILVLTIGRAAYYDTGGTSPEGMKMGGSHFLMVHTMVRLKEQGIATFSLDVANTEGLIKFKTGFGAREWPLQRVYLEQPSLISRLRRLLGR